MLEVVRRASDHPTAREVYERVRRQRPGIGVATVYRTLDLLADCGEVRTLALDGEAATRYDANTSDHHHARCTGCARVTDVDVDLPRAIVTAVTEQTGFTVDDADLLLRGRCPACRDPDRDPDRDPGGAPPPTSTRAAAGTDDRPARGAR